MSLPGLLERHLSTTGMSCLAWSLVQAGQCAAFKSTVLEACLLLPVAHKVPGTGTVTPPWLGAIMVHDAMEMHALEML